MDLKALLGEELYNQVVEKTGDNKIAVVSDGNWFPKSKFDEVNNDNKELKRQLKERDTQLDELSVKVKGNEELTNEINTLKEANKQAKLEYDQKLAELQKESKLELALKDAKAKNPKAVKALLDTEAIKLDGEKLLGLEEQLKALQESDSYLFGAEEQPSLRGRKPNDDPTPPATGNNPWKKGEMNLTEQGRILREDKDLAKQLISQAGGNPAQYGL